MFKLTIDDTLSLTLTPHEPGDRIESETDNTRRVVSALEGLYGHGYEDEESIETMPLVIVLTSTNEIIDSMTMKEIISAIGYLLTDEEE